MSSGDNKRKGESLGEEFRSREPPSASHRPAATTSSNIGSASSGEPSSFTFDFQPSQPRSGPCSGQATAPKFNFGVDLESFGESRMGEADDSQSDDGWPAGADDMLEAELDVAIHSHEEEKARALEEMEQSPADDEEMLGAPSEDDLFRQMDAARELTALDKGKGPAFPQHLRLRSGESSLSRRPAPGSPASRASPTNRASLNSSSPLRQATVATCISCEAASDKLDGVRIALEESEETCSELRDKVLLLRGQVGALERQTRELERERSNLLQHVSAAQHLQNSQGRQIKTLTDDLSKARDESRNLKRGYEETLEAAKAEMARRLDEQIKLVEELKMANGRLTEAALIRQQELEEEAESKGLKDTYMEDAEAAFASTLADKEAEKTEAEAAFARALAELTAEKVEAEAAYATSLSQKDAIQSESAAAFARSIAEKDARTTARVYRHSRALKKRMQTGHSLRRSTFLKGRAHGERPETQFVSAGMQTQPLAIQPVSVQSATSDDTGLVLRAEALEKANLELKEEVDTLRDTLARHRDAEQKNEEVRQHRESALNQSLDTYRDREVTEQAAYKAVMDERDCSVKQLAESRIELEAALATVKSQGCAMEELRERLQSSQSTIDSDVKERERIGRELEQAQERADALTADINRAREDERLRNPRQLSPPAPGVLTPSMEATVKAEVDVRVSRITRELTGWQATREAVIAKILADDTPQPPTARQHDLILKVQAEAEKSRAEVKALKEELQQAKEAIAKKESEGSDEPQISEESQTPLIPAERASMESKRLFQLFLVGIVALTAMIAWLGLPATTSKGKGLPAGAWTSPEPEENISLVYRDILYYSPPSEAIRRLVEYEDYVFIED